MIFVLLPERLAANAACPFGTHSDRLSVSFSKDSSVRSPHPNGTPESVTPSVANKKLHFLRTSYGIVIQFAMIITQLFAFFKFF